MLLHLHLLLLLFLLSAPQYPPDSSLAYLYAPIYSINMMYFSCARLLPSQESQPNIFRFFQKSTGTDRRRRKNQYLQVYRRDKEGGGSAGYYLCGGAIRPYLCGGASRLLSLRWRDKALSLRWRGQVTTSQVKRFTRPLDAYGRIALSNWLVRRNARRPVKRYRALCVSQNSLLWAHKHRILPNCDLFLL